MLLFNVASSIALLLVTLITRLYIINKHEGSRIKRSQHASYKKTPEIAFKVQQCFYANIAVNNDVDVYI